MHETVISPLVYSKDEYNGAAMLTSESLNKVTRLQTHLKVLFGDDIWLTPPACLHITLMEVISDSEYADMYREQHYIDWHQQYGKTTTETIASFDPFKATFDTVQASVGAIIIKASDPTPFNLIRTALTAKTLLPDGTRTPPTIAHCTIARYNSVIDLDNVINQTKTIAVNFEEPVREFKLVKDLVPPDFKPRIIKTYVLRKRH